MLIDQRLFRVAREEGKLLIYSVLSEILKTIFTIWFAWELSIVLDLVFLKDAGLTGIKKELWLLLLLASGRLLSGITASFTSISMAGKIKNKIRQQLLNIFLSLGISGLRQESSAEMNTTMNTGIEKLDAYFSQYLPQVFISALIPTIILFFTFPVDILSALVFLVTAPIIPVFMVLIGSLTETKTRHQWQTLSRMSSHFLDILQGLTTLKILGRSKEKSAEIEKVTELFRQTTMDVLKLAFLSALILEIAATVSTAVIAVEIGLRLLYAKISFQPALFVLILAPEFYQPFRQLGARFHASAEAISVMNRIQEIINSPAQIQSFQTIEPFIIDHPPELNIVNLGYTYPGREKPAIVSLNLHLPAGKITALTGPSGAGKTTLMNLICGLIQPQTGVIQIGGTDVQNIRENDFLRIFSWVPQKPYILNASVEENLRLSKPDATWVELQSAASSASLLEFINTLPEGWQTRVGEQGTRLSGGEVQRLALARAFLKNTPVLILDEPTSALDPVLEAEISATIRNLSAQRTTLIIAHRFQTVANADQVAVIQNGQIVQTGSPQNLLHQPGFLAQMVKKIEGHTV